MKTPYLVCPACSTKIKSEAVPRGHHVRCPDCRTVFDPKEQLEQLSSSGTDRLVGNQLGNYRIVRRIGQGGMGTVYEAVQGGLERQVALKVLSQKLCHDEPFIIRFQQEAKAAANLDHPNIVQVHEIAQDRGRLFFSMQYVEGESLLSRVKRNRALPLQEAVDILIQVIHALDYAYQRGIIHRDVKPDNILLTKSGSIKVADLGLAKSLSEPVGLTATGAGLGSPHYMAPEQGRGEKELGCRADIYALGITFFVMVTGMRPYSGKSPLDILMAHLRNPMPSANTFCEDLPPEVDEIIGRMAAKKPEDRYEDYTSLLTDLEALRRKVGTPGRLMNPLPFVVSRLKALHARTPRWAYAAAIAVCALCVGLLGGSPPLVTRLLAGLGGRAEASVKIADNSRQPPTRDTGSPVPRPVRSPATSPPGPHAASSGSKTSTQEASGTEDDDTPWVLEPIPPKPSGGAGKRAQTGAAARRGTAGTPAASQNVRGEPERIAPGRVQPSKTSGAKTASKRTERGPLVAGVRNSAPQAQLPQGSGELTLKPLPTIRPVNSRGLPSSPQKVAKPEQVAAHRELKFVGKAFRFGLPVPLAGSIEFEIICSRSMLGRPHRILALDGRSGFTVGVEKHGTLLATRRLPGKKTETAIGSQTRALVDSRWHKVRIKYGTGGDCATVDGHGRSRRTVPWLSTGDYGGFVLNPDRETGQIAVRNFRIEPWFPKRRAQVSALVEQGYTTRARDECRWMIEFSEDKDVREFAQTLLEKSVRPRLLASDKTTRGSRFSTGPSAPREMTEVAVSADGRLATGTDVPTFYIDRCEVSIKDYAEFLRYIRRTGDHSKCHPAEPEGKEHTPAGLGPTSPVHLLLPVHGVDWFDAYAYATWKGKRLPTRAEWQKAAGALQGNLYPWGREFLAPNVNLRSGLVPVNDYPSGRSPYGCYQMAGNIEEWCMDRIDRDGKRQRPLCGGSFRSGRTDILVRSQRPAHPRHREVTFGFRCASDPK